MTTAQPVFVQPNVFNLHGYNTRIQYAATGISGVPELTYREGDRSLKFTGDQIRVEATSLGKTVTVTLNSASLAIGPVETLTLLIPFTRLALETRETFMQTIAILSLRSVPRHLGQSQSYRTVCLCGTAQQSEFLNKQ